jgi:hypothetical protein
MTLPTCLEVSSVMVLTKSNRSALMALHMILTLDQLRVVDILSIYSVFSRQQQLRLQQIETRAVSTQDTVPPNARQPRLISPPRCVDDDDDDCPDPAEQFE